MKVKNINGTSDNICECPSWLDHWKKFSKIELSNYCYEENCIQKPDVGAHVQKYLGADNSWYIVPLCKKHNSQRGASITVGDGVILVSANVSTACENK